MNNRYDNNSSEFIVSQFIVTEIIVFLLNAIGDLFGVAILATFKVIMGLSFVTLISWLANSYWAEIIEFSI
ncbi:hypothetical protein [Brucella rhizosphaerae]|uniref:hypothetical protein n=1 Tax=Brucella rhizosphaerae TaxID=571254 RepID=UPI0011604BD7|nr:hypothetical protein [Brucella rhizosphaerae]